MDKKLCKKVRRVTRPRYTYAEHTCRDSNPLGNRTCQIPVQNSFYSTVTLVGWSDFEEKNATLHMLCQNVVGPQFQNFMP